MIKYKLILEVSKDGKTEKFGSTCAFSEGAIGSKIADKEAIKEQLYATFDNIMLDYILLSMK